MSMKITLSRFEDRLNALYSRQSSLEELVNSKLCIQDMQSDIGSGQSSFEDGGHFPAQSRSCLPTRLTVPTNRLKQLIGKNLKASGGDMKACDIPLLNNICRSVKYVETSLKIVCQINRAEHEISTELESLQKSLKSHLKYLQHEQAKITVTQVLSDTKTNRKSVDDTSPTVRRHVTPGHRGGHTGGNGYRRRGEHSHRSPSGDLRRGGEHAYRIPGGGGRRGEDSYKISGGDVLRGGEHSYRSSGGDVLRGGELSYRSSAGDVLRGGEHSYRSPGGGGRTAAEGRYEDHSTSQ